MAMRGRVVTISILYFFTALSQFMQWDSLSGTDGIYKMPAHPVQIMMYSGAFLYILSAALLFLNKYCGAIVSFIGFIVDFPLCFKQFMAPAFQCFFEDQGIFPRNECIYFILLDYFSIFLLVTTACISISILSRLWKKQ